ncbi:MULTISPECIES: Na+/H+ antiporter NhaA [unclassified Brevundimonas]|uniref:Na+/H+ antiporter NhaA n=1 Tax=unclassified Brevundimonas TaxID=2622653 RepID=UPI0006FBA7DD|nr:MULTISPECIES: Na+/H+ antiporter NhaA [unclassified Brevundimonas]KQY86335.1 sodium:proton antiporter [Brevundimonas sp. Root1423]KRA26525.1 sodium:proton antiporter [Brevundimonas sp. Root608]
MARKLTLEFLKTEAGSGAVLGLAALAALIVANSPLSAGYFGWLKSEHVLQVGPLALEMSISEWIKEGLMAVFFLVVGLEIKYEILRGELSDPRKLATPVLAAAGGMIAPALVYLALSSVMGGPHGGWPIPLATDIAFALAVFAMVARRLPSSLRVFLLTLAIVDDLGAIALIAALFSSGVSLQPLAGIVALLVVGFFIARSRRIPAPFWVLGFSAVWYLTVLAGLSTSLTAVAFAAIVPVVDRRDDGQSPLREAMHDLHPYVAFLVLPMFAFAKAGVSFAGLSLDQMLAPLVLGVALGLFIGKQVGVLGAAWLASALRIGARPTGATWLEVYGVSLLCGVGFTMSLFIGTLAFPGAIDSPEQVEVKLGVLLGSLLSALAGGAVLAAAARRRKNLAEQTPDTIPT